MKPMLFGIAAIAVVAVDAGANATALISQVASLTPETIVEAIRLSEDDKAVSKFMALYQVQLHTGWGDGPLLGAFNTPFSRVVQAALAARSRGETLVPDNVPASLLEPELHVVALSQPALATDDKAVARVQSVVLAPRGGPDTADVVSPVAQVELNDDYKKLLGLKVERPGVVAKFPLKVLKAGMEVRVVFDQVARARSPAAMCRVCVAPLSLTRIR